MDLKVRLGRSNSKMVVYWEVLCPQSRRGQWRSFVWLVLVGNICIEAQCQWRCLLVLFWYDGSIFYDSQQGVGRVNVKYRNGLNDFSHWIPVSYQISPLYMQKRCDKRHFKIKPFFCHMLKHRVGGFNDFFWFFTIPLTGSKHQLLH